MLNELTEIIGRRAEDAGFSRTSTQQYLSDANQNWQDGAIGNELGYWESSFASILLVNITTDTDADAMRQAKIAETFLDAAIVQRERSGLVIDGYLVIAATQVTDQFKAFILDIERDIRFVRKHVVTWGADGWERYERITPLGLERIENQGDAVLFTSENADYLQLVELLAEVDSQELAQIHGKEWNLNE
ncbi:hypothetical protein [Pseudomonas viridiflava]|uniref:hypothetical protein n=1 Tax=Pseudomonas viridiflava TaxID=33069 RepID=UPI000F029AF2|nr:hypothetical protein [Pseudomonas viridiflava]MEE4222738.1 hypothetical protein [Pseudomonas viridiflava]